MFSYHTHEYSNYSYYDFSNQFTNPRAILTCAQDCVCTKLQMGTHPKILYKSVMREYTKEGTTTSRKLYLDTVIQILKNMKRRGCFDFLPSEDEYLVRIRGDARSRASFEVMMYDRFAYGDKIGQYGIDEQMRREIAQSPALAREAEEELQKKRDTVREAVEKQYKANQKALEDQTADLRTESGRAEPKALSIGHKQDCLDRESGHSQNGNMDATSSRANRRVKTVSEASTPAFHAQTSTENRPHLLRGAISSPFTKTKSHTQVSRQARSHARGSSISTAATNVTCGSSITPSESISQISSRRPNPDRHRSSSQYYHGVSNAAPRTRSNNWNDQERQSKVSSSMHSRSRATTTAVDSSYHSRPVSRRENIRHTPFASGPADLALLPRRGNGKLRGREISG